MTNLHLRLVAPATIKRTVAPRRRPNAEYRTREHLTETEVEKLIESTKDNRYGHRDSTMILVAFRHGLRASELVSLRWDQIDFEGGRLHVRKMLVARAGVTAGFRFQLHPHMFRHSCGFKLANDGVDTRSLQAYLGHRSIQHTVRYTELAPGRFKDFWQD